MNKTLIKSFLCAGLAGGIALSASAQLHMSEDFESYTQTSDMTSNWTWDDTGSNNGLVFEGTGGNPGQSAFFDNDSSTEGAFQGFFNAFWTGSAINVTPTNANPMVLSGDIFYHGASNQRNTIGLRTGASPLFEVGFYNSGNNGLGARILNFAGNENWVEVVSYGDLGTDPRWISTTTTVTGDSVSIDFVDSLAEINGGFGSITLNSTGENPTGAFTDLRVGGPSDVGSGTGGTSYDNISLETIPEPSTYAAIFGGLALLGAFVYRRRLSVKK